MYTAIRFYYLSPKQMLHDVMNSEADWHVCHKWRDVVSVNASQESEGTWSGIKLAPRWPSDRHVPTQPLNQTYWSASLLAVRTHIKARAASRAVIDGGGRGDGRGERSNDSASGLTWEKYLWSCLVVVNEYVVLSKSIIQHDYSMWAVGSLCCSLQ